MALQYVKPDTTSNPINERQLSYQEANDLGYILPYSYLDWNRGIIDYGSQASQLGSGGPIAESKWQDLFDRSLADIDPVLNSGAPILSGNPVQLKSKAVESIKLRTEAIKSETGRNVGRSKAIIQRLARAAGGLLAGSATPSLDGGKGLPDLGTGTTALSKATTKIGTKAKI